MCDLGMMKGAARLVLSSLWLQSLKKGFHMQWIICYDKTTTLV